MAIKTFLKNGVRLYEVYVNGTDSSGRRVQRRKRSVETLRKAQIAEFELKRELALLKEQRVPYRWVEWFDICLSRMKVEYKPSTTINYETQLKKWIHPHFKDREIQSITKYEIHETIHDRIGDGLTLHTKKSVLKMVRRIFQMAVEEGVLDRNPCTGISIKVPETDQKVLTTAEVEIFLREARITNHRFYPIWVVALMTGMRSGEMFALRWTDIDLVGQRISVSRQWSSSGGFGPTKTQRSRVVPISDELLKFLKELKLKRGTEKDGDEFVLPHPKEWETREQARTTRQFCQAIGITPIKFHDLRATFITHLLARGESLARVMAIVGHTQLKTTNGYLRKAGVELQGATEKLGFKLHKEGDAQILPFTRSVDGKK